jgi:hypothetical protein
VLLLCVCASASQIASPSLALCDEKDSVEREPYVEPPPAVLDKCEQRIQALYVVLGNVPDYAALNIGLEHGDMPPGEWLPCAGHLLRTLAAAGRAADFLDRMGYTYRRLLRSDGIESDERLQARVRALHQVFLARPAGVVPHPAVTSELLDDLTQALQKKRLGPFATRYGEDLLLEFGLLQNRWRSQPLTPTDLDALLEQKKEGLLRRIIERAPDTNLREEARRRIVRLHISASAWPEVKAQASEVEAAVLQRGHFAISLSTYPFVRGRLSEQITSVQSIVAKQDIWRQSITLQPASTDPDKAAVMPTFNLREALSLELRGLSQPVSLCGKAADLDVTPCLEPTEVHIQDPIASLDGEGYVHFAANLPTDTVVAWIRKQPELSFSLEVGGRTFSALHWPVAFSLPESMDFSAKPGAPGPSLDVRVEPLDGQRLLVTVRASGHSYLGVLEREHLGQFSVVSHGGAGKPGEHGVNGGVGGKGETGAAGGNIQVQVVCETAECGGLPYVARKLVDSQGGQGGPGGAGGQDIRLGVRGGGRRGGGGPPPQAKRGANGDNGPAGRVEVVEVKPEHP